MDNLVIIIMAGGEGKRMRSNIPKILHTFNNIPILIRIIKESIKVSPNKIIIVTGKYDQLIKETVIKYIDNMSKISFVQQTTPNGTADSVKTALPYINYNDNILILNGDMPLINYQLLNNFINNFNKENKAQLLVANLDEPFGYGRIIYKNNIFKEIREEKDCNEIEKEIKTINVGIYLFTGELLKKYIPLIDNNNNQKEYYLTDIVKVIKKFENHIDIKTYLIEDEIKYMILGVNTPEELNQLESLYN
jgi:UDP-N-acetylglucosamine diphosphorylase/glucosamine-1-phosphate N-acetyltransferase